MFLTVAGKPLQLFARGCLSFGTEPTGSILPQFTQNLNTASRVSISSRKKKNLDGVRAET
jgi:hypothetical protein